METTPQPKVRVEQHSADPLLAVAQIRRLNRGDFVADGMCHGTTWSWTRLRVVANDRKSATIVVRFPDGEYFVSSYIDADQLWTRWSAVASRPAFMQSDLSTWAADAD